jgi:NCS1 family nucleobase:cation symporter-1
VIAPFFVVAGGVLAIVTFITTGALDNDLAKMLIQIASPMVALVTLVLIAFANVGTHGTGTYMWSVVIKSAFPKARYPVIVGILAAYAALIVLWGQIIEYFGAMISIAAYLYGPLMGLLFVDYFWVRRRRIDLRSAYELPGRNTYRYSGGYNWIGFACLIVGFLASSAVFDALTYTARVPLFNYTTASFLGFLVAGGAYLAVSSLVPAARTYLLADRGNVTV